MSETYVDFRFLVCIDEGRQALLGALLARVYTHKQKKQTVDSYLVKHHKKEATNMRVIMKEEI